MSDSETSAGSPAPRAFAWRWSRPAEMTLAPVRPVAAAAWLRMSLVLLPVLILIMPPEIAFLNNEETKFGLAARALDPAFSPESFAFARPQALYVIWDTLTQGLIVAFGIEGAHIAGRIIAAVAYALGTGYFFAACRIGPLTGAGIIAAYWLVGQELMARAWLFGSYEPKTLAYAAIFGAFGALVCGRPLRAFALAGLATCLHMLIGAFWALFMGLYLAWRWRDPARLAIAAGLYMLIASPILIVAALNYGAYIAPPQADGIPPVDTIYAAIRAPHHVAPFLNMDSFWRDWAPGFAALAAILGGALWLRRQPEAPPDAVTGLAIIGAAFCLLALPIAYLDTEYALAKLFLFRPSTVVLFLAFTAAAVALSPRRRIVMPLSALLIAAFVTLSAQHILAHGANQTFRLNEMKPVYRAVIENTPPDAVVLLHGRADYNMIDFERRTGRAAYVSFKFIPPYPDQIVEWYTRLQKRETIYEEGCAAAALAEVDYVVLNQVTRPSVFNGCAEPLYADKFRSLIRILHGQ